MFVINWLINKFKKKDDDLRHFIIQNGEYYEVKKCGIKCKISMDDLLKVLEIDN